MSGIDKEWWLPIPGWEDLYEVSSHGKVRSLDRMVVHRLNTRPFLQSGRILKPGLSSNGYLTVNLCRNGSQVAKCIHELVLIAFVGPPPKPSMECLHGPNGKLDNHWQHLRWDTSTENKLDMQRNGTDYHRNLTHCKFSHKLMLPNLVKSVWNKGYRDCLACARARANRDYALRKGYPFDLQVKADEHYAKIMSTDLATRP